MNKQSETMPNNESRQIEKDETEEKRYHSSANEQVCFPPQRFHRLRPYLQLCWSSRHRKSLQDSWTWSNIKTNPGKKKKLSLSPTLSLWNPQVKYVLLFIFFFLTHFLVLEKQINCERLFQVSVKGWKKYIWVAI